VPKKNFLFEKITLFQSRSKFSFAEVNYFFDVFFWIDGFFSLCFEISFHEPVNVILKCYMIYLDLFYAKPLARHIMIDEAFSHPVKLVCPPFSSFFA